MWDGGVPDAGGVLLGLDSGTGNQPVRLSDFNQKRTGKNAGATAAMLIERAPQSTVTRGVSS